VNYLFLAASTIGKFLEEDPKINKAARLRNRYRGEIHETYGKKGEQKKRNWLRKYKT
jgi:hypothetical protein